MTTMQKVQAKLPSWEQTKTTGKKGYDQGKKGFDKVWAWADKLGAPINRLTNRIGSEAFWPTTLDKESDKAARILRSFCKDGFYTETETTPVDGPKQKQRVLQKIPQRVMERAVGLAIFTTMRTGLWVSGAGGSGVLVARLPDGSWSPPSGILLHTAGLGFLVGVDIYDCVLVINNPRALEAFTHIRATLGGEISAVAGPVGAGGVLEHDGKWKQANRPIFTYLKSRGFYAGVQVDGTIVIERTDENARFYGEKIGVADILAGKALHPPRDELRLLTETLKAAEGRTDIDEAVLDELEGQPAPGDVEVDAPGGAPAGPSSEAGDSFGIPDPTDPDPYGVLALERAGLEVRDAATRSRPTSQQFEFHPSPTSPIFNHFHRRSVGSRSRWSVDRDRFFRGVDAEAQTDPVIITPVPMTPEQKETPETDEESTENNETDGATTDEKTDHQPSADLETVVAGQDGAKAARSDAEKDTAKQVYDDDNDKHPPPPPPPYASHPNPWGDELPQPPRGTPPPVPPRAPRPQPKPDFEEVNLSDKETNA